MDECVVETTVVLTFPLDPDVDAEAERGKYVDNDESICERVEDTVDIDALTKPSVDEDGNSVSEF